jgi:hypothetical protein
MYLRVIKILIGVSIIAGAIVGGVAMAIPQNGPGTGALFMYLGVVVAVVVTFPLVRQINEQ